MVSVLSLWLPILLSAVGVFIVSSIVHMVLPFHKNDFATLSNEDAVMDALRAHNIPTGDYLFPKPRDMQHMKSQEFQDKWRRGPVAVLTVMPNATMSMGKQLSGWFVYSLVVSIFAAYIASRAVAPGGDYWQVFRFAATTAFLAYGAALWQHTIWWHRPAATTLRSNVDALLYGLVTGAVLGWLWP